MASSRNVQSPQRLQAQPQLSRSKPLLSQASPQTLVPHLAAITMAVLLHRKMLLPMSGPKAHKCGSRMPAFTDVRETFLMRHAKHTTPNLQILRPLYLRTFAERRDLNRHLRSYQRAAADRQNILLLY
jgi:hypothetical protein